MINLTWYDLTVRWRLGLTFDFVAERASLELVKNDLAWKGLGRRRFLSEDFLREEGAGEAERRGGKGSEEVGEAATVGVVSGGGGGAAVEKAALDDVGGGASGGERSEQNGGYPSHSVASEIWIRSLTLTVLRWLRSFTWKGLCGFRGSTHTGF